MWFWCRVILMGWVCLRCWWIFCLSGFSGLLVICRCCCLLSVVIWVWLGFLKVWRLCLCLWCVSCVCVLWWLCCCLMWFGRGLIVWVVCWLVFGVFVVCCWFMCCFSCVCDVVGCLICIFKVICRCWWLIMLKVEVWLYWFCLFLVSRIRYGYWLLWFVCLWFGCVVKVLWWFLWLIILLVVILFLVFCWCLFLLKRI